MATYDEINQEFAPQRQRAQQAVNTQTQQRRDAITRRMAQLGGGPSGAGIKAEQQAIAEGAQQLEQANQAIDTAARSEFRRVKEIDDARAFQRGEREASQAFGSAEAAKGREFARGERLGSQEFAHGERLGGQEFARGERLGGQEFAALQAELQRKYGTSEREASQLFQTGEREATQGWQTGEREASQTFAGEQAELARRFQRAENFYNHEFEGNWRQKQFALEIERFAHEKDVDAFNMDLANRLSRQKDPLERLFDFSGAKSFFSDGASFKGRRLW